MLHGTCLGERLRALREMAGISARELSRLLTGDPDSARRHIGLIESGQRPDPQTTTVARLAELFGVTTDWLIMGAGVEPVVDDVKASVEAARMRIAPLPSTGTED